MQPLGLAERGLHGHRNRFRLPTCALEAWPRAIPTCTWSTSPPLCNAKGAERLLDDGLVGFTHFGSPGWMLQRPESEKAAVHGLFPDLAPLIAAVGRRSLRARERDRAAPTWTPWSVADRARTARSA